MYAEKPVPHIYDYQLGRIQEFKTLNVVDDFADKQKLTLLGEH